MPAITTPTLLLDEARCKANIARMVEKARHNGLVLAPHFKTHQSATVAQWFRDAGVEQITVTSVKMAQYFAENGWNEITVAFPVNILEVEAINQLAKKIDLTIFVNAPESAAYLSETLQQPVHFYIELDVGYQRSGVQSADYNKVDAILTASDPNKLLFSGFYTHAGHTYDIKYTEELKAIHNKSLDQLRQIKAQYIQRYPELKISMGDTPSCSVFDQFEGVDIIRPGNFVFYDLKQNSVGSNSIDQIAICLAVPVVSIHPERSELMTHSGWAHLGKDSLIDGEGNTHYGLVVKLNDQGWAEPIPGAFVKKLSQEHGTIYMPPAELTNFKIGDVVGILPVHACATTIMMKSLTTLSGRKIHTLASSID